MPTVTPLSLAHTTSSPASSATAAVSAETTTRQASYSAAAPSRAQVSRRTPQSVDSNRCNQVGQGQPQSLAGSWRPDPPQVAGKPAHVRGAQPGRVPLPGAAGGHRLQVQVARLLQALEPLRPAARQRLGGPGAHSVEQLGE